MANTAIFIEGGLVLNSEKCQNYSLLIIDIGENFDKEDETPPVIELLAQTGEKELISTFYEIDEACEALSSLLKALQDGEREWDVSDYNSNI